MKPVLAVLLLIPGTAMAQQGINIAGAPYVYRDLGTFASSSLATSSALPTIPANAAYAYVTVEGQGIRWVNSCSTLAGAITTPTTSAGNLVLAGSQVLFQNPLSCIRIIQVAASASIDVEYVY